jgi:hypothetical protein
MKFYLLFVAAILFSTTCHAGTIINSGLGPQQFILKKNESKLIGSLKIKMLSVGHTFSSNGHSLYANLEISENGNITKPTIYLGKEIPIGDMYLKLLGIDEKADPRLRDPFASTSCTLVVSDQFTAKADTNLRTIPSTPPKEYCFKNEGLKNKTTISFTVEGKMVTDGEFEVSDYQDNNSAEIYHFNGTKTGNVLTVKFTGTVPNELDKIKKIIWSLGKTNLKIQMFGKNYRTNKWSFYTASFNKCEL